MHTEATTKRGWFLGTPQLQACKEIYKIPMKKNIIPAILTALYLKRTFPTFQTVIGMVDLYVPIERNVWLLLLTLDVLGLIIPRNVHSSPFPPLTGNKKP